MILAFDTETTGLPDFKSRSNADHQPHLVQLAALLFEDDGTEVSSIDLIIRPDEWQIPDVVAKIHGITTEKATRCGVSEPVATTLFLDLVNAADFCIAHNAPFDVRIMRIACARYNLPKDLAKPAICTMKPATPIVNCPPTERMIAAGFTGPKAPRLEECMKHFFDESLDGAHNALVDVRACARLFFHLRDAGSISMPVTGAAA